MSQPQPVVSNLHELGRTAYEAYYEYSQGMSLINGEVLPLWNELTDNIKFGWTAAAKAVVIRVGYSG